MLKLLKEQVYSLNYTSLLALHDDITWHKQFKNHIPNLFISKKLMSTLAYKEWNTNQPLQIRYYPRPASLVKYSNLYRM